MAYFGIRFKWLLTPATSVYSKAGLDIKKQILFLNANFSVTIASKTAHIQIVRSATFLATLQPIPMFISMII